MEKREYYLGLDLGTSSVGWAVTDANYHILRAKEKDLWGVRLFEEAQTAADRRSKRISRRRRQRQTARIGLLKEYFKEAIESVDPLFYERLDESKYHFEDKKVQEKFSIFADKNYTDKMYYKDYPTIYHLRMELIDNPKPHDVRLVYLAILNMFKHRGHFLNAGLKDDGINNNIDEDYHLLTEMANEQYGLQLPQVIDIQSFENVLKKRGISRSAMAEELSAVLNIVKSKNKREYEIVKGICGLAVSLNTLLEVKEFDENHKKVQISFRKAAYDENLDKISSLIEEEDIEFIELIKKIHDTGLLLNVMKGSHYLSEARVKDYEKHKKDLALLKHVIKEYAPEKYDELFRNMEPGSYSAYVNSVNSQGKNTKSEDGKSRRNVKGRKQKEGKQKEGKQKELYDSIRKILKEVDGCEEKAIILKEMDAESFLPKQLTASNGVIPNQVHVAELKKILSNAEKYLVFLNDRDESGYTVSERIIQLFKFQIPYYVGPLNTQHKDKKKGMHGW